MFENVYGAMDSLGLGSTKKKLQQLKAKERRQKRDAERYGTAASTTLTWPATDVAQPPVAPLIDVPAEDVPAEGVPVTVEDVPAEDVPAEDIPAEDIPAEDIPAEDDVHVTVGEAPIEDAFMTVEDDVVLEDTPREDVHVIVEDVPVEDVPAEDDVHVTVEEAPIEDAPIEDAPMTVEDDVVLEDTPREDVHVTVEKAPIEDVPVTVEDVPVTVEDDTVLEDTPREDVHVNVEEAPIEDAPVTVEDDVVLEDTPREDVHDDVHMDTEHDDAEDNADDVALAPQSPTMFSIADVYPTSEGAEALDNPGSDDPLQTHVQAQVELHIDEIPASTDSVPKLVFIVPYRDREAHLNIFKENMQRILTTMSPLEYRMLIVHQHDDRPFNRGALKNIGFLAVKQLYPDHYRNITCVFNDVDTFPSQAGIIPNYTASLGVVKHFYGYTFALGGIVSITGADFERVNGFPNYWAWGFEDNMLDRRIRQAGMVIDRTCFYAISDPRIIQLKTAPERTVNRGEFDRYSQSRPEGISSITKLDIDIDTSTGWVEVNGFETEYVCNPDLNRQYDTRSTQPPFLVGFSARRNARLNLVM